MEKGWGRKGEGEWLGEKRGGGGGGGGCWGRGAFG